MKFLVLLKQFMPISMLLLVLFSFTTAKAAEFTVNSIDQFNALSLSPGDVVIWSNGNYSDDERLVFNTNGTSSNPITLRAETPGGVKFTGGMQMDIAGNYLIVEDFYWQGGYGASNFIQFRNGTTYAQNSILRNCVIDGLGVEPGDAAEAAMDGAIVKHRWVVLYGNNNSVLSCSFLNKTTAGALVLVELEYNAEAGRCNIVGHTISNNYFYKYDKMDPSLSNAGDSETIRVGTSEYQNVDCQTVVSHNYFVESDGENEIITNKSDNNTYLKNTFRRCRGSLTLRHGSGATVSENYFLGENVDGTGGIRIVDSDHIITNNYIQDCITVLSQAKWNNGITFMGGSTSSQDDCNSTSVSNGYQKSEDITVSNNTLVNTNAPLFYNGDKGTSDNTGTVSNNVIYFSPNSSNITDVITEDDPGDFNAFGSTLTYSGNVYDNTNLGQSASGFSTITLSASSNGEIFDITGTSGGASISCVPYTDSDVSISVGACFVNAIGSSASGDCSNIVVPPILSLTVQPSTLNFLVAGGSISFTVTSDVAWQINENLSWLTLDVTSGSAGTTIVTATAIANTSAQRTGSISINEIAGGNNLSATVSVIQSGVTVPMGDTGTGEVIITEYHNRPQKPTQSQLDAALPNNPTGANTTPNEGHTEWFEIYNTTDDPVVMDGWILIDASNDNTSTITNFTIPANCYAVFAGFNIPDAQGGLQFDYFYDYKKPSFNNESSYEDPGDTNCPDGVIIEKADGTLVDEVKYDYGYGEYIGNAGASSLCQNNTQAIGIPPAGSSSKVSFMLNVDPSIMNATDNDLAANWSYSTLVYDPTNNQRGTPGLANDGTACSPVVDPCISDLVLSGTNTTTGLEEAEFTISSTEFISLGAAVEYSAGMTIHLNEGFEVESGSELHAYILGCN